MFDCASSLDFHKLIESNRCEIGSMFMKQKTDVLVLCETKIKGKGESEFGEVKGRISGI